LSKLYVCLNATFLFFHKEKQMKVKNFAQLATVLVLVGVLVVASVSNVLADTGSDVVSVAQSAPTSENWLQEDISDEIPAAPIDVALLLTFTAFFKTQFDIKGKWVLLTAFIIGALLLIDNQLTFPPLVESLIGYVKFFIGSFGSVDFANGLAKAFGTAASAKKTAGV
jgi:cytochrome bd-type quinol oxidase subunit 2